jgi:hypothetical protein
MPYIPSAPAGQAGDMPYAPASRIPAETGFGHHAAFMPPIYGQQERDMSLELARQQHRLRLKSSPPMLGTDLTFRMCPSPKQTKLEPNHLWDVAMGTTKDDHNRDPTEQYGLWHGYCYANSQNEDLVRIDRPQMITTPLPSSTPKDHDPFAHAFGGETPSITEEPSSTLDGTTRAPSLSPQPVGGVMPEHRTKSHEPKGLHMLHNLQNLDEKLRREKEAAELEEKIAAEFDDHFVTQVYNYLSLGYPATARQYDEELSKISRIGVDELERDDEDIMEGLWGQDHHQNGGENNENGTMPKEKEVGKKVKATGHIMLDSEAKDGVREEDRCSRWKALKLYIYEWARQHPDLNAISPLAWGVQERKGSWGV